MITGIGIDAVEIERFAAWHTYPEKQLLKILSAEEIAYCKENPRLSAQRFAVRFATREAFFKAWNSAAPEQYIPFLTCCRSLTLKHNSNGAPLLHINWHILGFNSPLFFPLITLTHTNTTAIASVVLQGPMP
ncbi:MAG: hypothetical protein ACD_64C00176G0003 [uncultured bacterium]|jgi:phosphopantetheine--protein transferase-like protein|nr:MAG: hypothetical protein ACD_64C00176G0003 [uncultured bacterium]HLE76455.1 4'-phosphopantetheinyl transferase superfamily protein [Candidatus Babeliales bacterium]